MENPISLVLVLLALNFSGCDDGGTLELEIHDREIVNQIKKEENLQRFAEALVKNNEVVIDSLIDSFTVLSLKEKQTLIEKTLLYASNYHAVRQNSKFSEAMKGPFLGMLRGSFETSFEFPDSVSPVDVLNEISVK